MIGNSLPPLFLLPTQDFGSGFSSNALDELAELELLAAADATPDGGGDLPDPSTAVPPPTLNRPSSSSSSSAPSPVSSPSSHSQDTQKKAFGDLLAKAGVDGIKVGARVGG